MPAKTVSFNRNTVVLGGVAAVVLLLVGVAVGRATSDGNGDLSKAVQSAEPEASDGATESPSASSSSPSPTSSGPAGGGASSGGGASASPSGVESAPVGSDVPEPSSDDVYRFTVGGAQYEDSHGNTWEPATCTGGEAYVSPNPIEGTDDDVLFQARQFEPSCSLSVDDGEYEVTLGWAETYRANAGYRVFDVVMEDEEVATIDVGGSAGMNRTYFRTFRVVVRDGALDVEADEVENRPMLALVIAARVGDAPAEPEPATGSGGAPREPGVLGVGPGQEFATLQSALDAAQPGDTVRLATPGEHEGPARSTRDGAADRPITITAVDGARLECGSPDEDEVARCFELAHSYYVFDHMSIEGGSSNLYMVGGSPGSYVHDVKVINSTFRGARSGGTGECIRVKYQAFNVEIAKNDIADCGLGKCCDGSKNGEAVYIGTAPEQLEDKNPSSEPDATHDVWVHDNVMKPLNECVDIKEAAHDNLVEHNTCSGQQDSDAAGMGSRGGRVGAGNTFRFNVVTDTVGACARFGGDEEPDGSGNSFYGNVCRNIAGEYAINQQVEPQGPVCGNTFEGGGPRKKISRTDGVDPAAPCPADVSMDGAASPGAR